MPACVGIVALSQALLLWTHRRGSRLSRRYAAVLGVLAAGILGWTASRAIGAPLPGLGGSGVWTWAMVGISGLTILGHEALRPSAEHLDVDPDVFS